ncbi:MAG: hypothetical protein KKD01_00595 [Proteobacteria bacterium]|nr:hypothetical protein [Pseudomonadota bacterium]MBU1453196.1 hypothetical protein [Pseudomonadota bacterium]
MNDEYADLGKFKFTEDQLHKAVFDIQNPDEQVSASEFSAINQLGKTNNE